MNKHLSKVTLLFLACFSGQTNPVWISQPDFERELQRHGLPRYGRGTHREANCFDTASWVWVHYPCMVPWQTNIPTVAKFLAFLEGADSDSAAIAANPALQLRRISVLKDLQEVLLQIFRLILQNNSIDPIQNAHEIDFNADFGIDHNLFIDHDLFRDLGQYFNEFVHEIEALQDAPHREIVKRDIYKVHLHNFVRKIIVRLQARFAHSDDQIEDAVKKIKIRLGRVLQSYNHDLVLLNKLELEFKDQENSIHLPYHFDQHVEEIRVPKMNWTILLDGGNVGQLRLQKRQFAVVVDFLNAFKFELDSLFPFSQELVVSGFADLIGNSAVLRDDPNLFTDATGLSSFTGIPLPTQKELLEEQKEKIRSARTGIKSP